MTRPGERPTVLIVDDTPENIRVLIECLGDAYATQVATDGTRALQLAHANHPPDIILLDVDMPGMDGFAVCSHLKSTPHTAAIPIIFITAMGDEKSERRGLELGAVDYITKPFSPPLVNVRIRNQLELKRHRDNLEERVAERTRELTLTQDAAIFGLALLAEYRDRETGLHIRRTQHYVNLLARHLANAPRFRGYFDPTTVRLLLNSAPLHDIGKVAVPDLILHKPGAFTPAEFALMQQHTLHGRDVIRRIEADMHNPNAAAFLQLAEEIAYTHHERWDGTGYHGLAGDAIPVSGRLMALADVYDALRSHRVYKPAFSHDDAIRILTQGDGRTAPEHFDPDILQAFIDLNLQFQEIAARLKD